MDPAPPEEEESRGRKCAIVGVPWWGSVSACLAWGDLLLNDMFKRVLKRLSFLRHHCTPMMAHLQLPEGESEIRKTPLCKLGGQIN